MNQKKPTLGRGLADLLGQTRASVGAAPAAGAAAPAASREEELQRLPLDLLQRGRYQPRLDMRPESLSELVDSIRAQGVVQPIVVRPLDALDEAGVQRYEIIAGERRWRAAQQAGLAVIPAVIRRVPDEAAIAMALIENIQREDLNPLEEARALERLISEFDLTHSQAADAVGRSRVYVTNLLRLLELPDEVCERVATRQMDMGHARALLGLSQRRQQVEVGALVVKKSLSVRDTEALVRQMSQPRPPAQITPVVDPNILRLQQDLSEKLGATVAIEHSQGGRGRLVVKYNSLDELEGILSHIV
jgi:ParB family chromosome partitioning protein